MSKRVTCQFNNSFITEEVILVASGGRPKKAVAIFLKPKVMHSKCKKCYGSPRVHKELVDKGF